ncbi:dihydrofolate reductase family protein [Marinomonas sp.]|uniref:dihydrofolate reductase family protein n=1 Tax=Marinomonas sp. TaxID=1904862 RepID=UPI003A915C22
MDGGKTIQSFLKEDLIDKVIITQFPILLGGGTPLFGMLKQPLKFTLTDNKVVLNELLQTSYQRKRSTSP